MKRAPAPPTEFASAEQFQDKTYKWIYTIPIRQVFDAQYGRIEAELEPIVKRGKIVKLYLGFRQHELPELQGHFEIPTPQANRRTGISTSIRDPQSFFAGVWMVGVCWEHGGMAFRSYPPDDAVALYIECLTTNITVYWKRKGER